MKKNCELCKLPARTFCESDQASLCWDCDSKVHSANFLVARHTRTLLCHRCQSPTPWKASGARLCNALSLCERCGGGRKLEGEEEESEGDNEDEDEVDTDFDEEEEDEVDGDEDGDNQVVPWSSTEAPPPASSSSGSEESVSKCNDDEDEIVSKLVTTNTVSLKRRRDDRDFQASDSKNCENQLKYGGARRKDDGEPSSKASIRKPRDGKDTEKSQPHD